MLIFLVGIYLSVVGVGGVRVVTHVRGAYILTYIHAYIPTNIHTYKCPTSAPSENV